LSICEILSGEPGSPGVLTETQACEGIDTFRLPGHPTLESKLVDYERFEEANRPDWKKDGTKDIYPTHTPPPPPPPTTNTHPPTPPPHPPPVTRLYSGAEDHGLLRKSPGAEDEAQILVR